VRARFQCVTAAQIKPQMESVVRKCSEQIGLTESDTRLLLLSYGWRTERLLEAWVEDAGETVRRVAGLSDRPDPPEWLAPSPPCPPPPSSPSPLPHFTCPSTLDAYPQDQFDACPCRHFFSREALTSALQAAMSDPTAAQLTRCLAAPACRELFRPRLVQAHLPPASHARWEDFAVRSYASAARHIQWCPGLDCPYAMVHGEGTGCVEDVVCGGGHVFCFGCGEGEGHAPARCREVAEWGAKGKNEGATAVWLAKHTKACPNPKCKRQIERSSGCNKVICTQCGTAMCFACGLEYYKEAGHT
jgi:ariadne-1